MKAWWHQLIESWVRLARGPADWRAEPVRVPVEHRLPQRRQLRRR